MENEQATAGATEVFEIKAGDTGGYIQGLIGASNRLGLKGLAVDKIERIARSQPELDLVNPFVGIVHVFKVHGKRLDQVEG